MLKVKVLVYVKIKFVGEWNNLTNDYFLLVATRVVANAVFFHISGC